MPKMAAEIETHSKCARAIAMHRKAAAEARHLAGAELTLILSPFWIILIGRVLVDWR